MSIVEALVEAMRTRQLVYSSFGVKHDMMSFCVTYSDCSFSSSSRAVFGIQRIVGRRPLQHDLRVLLNLLCGVPSCTIRLVFGVVHVCGLSAPGLASHVSVQAPTGFISLLVPC